MTFHAHGATETLPRTTEYTRLAQCQFHTRRAVASVPSHRRAAPLATGVGDAAALLRQGGESKKRSGHGAHAARTSTRANARTLAG
eukprot:1006941-Pleurochrysis_carterae.AAC.1